MSIKTLQRLSLVGAFVWAAIGAWCFKTGSPILGAINIVTVILFLYAALIDV